MNQDAYTLGLASVSFRQHAPREILEAARRAGLSCIEWGSDIHAPCRDTGRLQEISALQGQYGISCSSYGTYFRLGETPMAELEAYLQAARILGTDILRLWCGSKSGREMTATERKTLLSDCQTAARIAERQGVKLCLECHKGTFTEYVEDAAWLMKQVHSPSFRMYWQPFQWQNFEQNMSYAAQIAAYTEHIHVFHWKGADKLPLATAAQEWRCYLRHFPPPRALLLEFMPDHEITTLPREAAALRDIAGGGS